MHDQPWNPTNAASIGLIPRTDESCLPSDLIASIPVCAIACTQEFVESHYQDPSCSSTTNLSALCTEGNTSGLTIGEGSIQCIISDCSGSDLESIGVYNICKGIPGAVPNTATVITATIGTSAMASPATSTDVPLFPTSIGQPDATQQITSVVMASGVPSLSTQNPPAPTTLFSQDSPSAGELTATYFTPGSSTSRSPSSASSSKGSIDATSVADKATPSSSLGSSQVVGIALGASAVALITLAFIFFWCRHRKQGARRRNKRRSMYAHQTPPPKYDGLSADNGFLAPPSRNSTNLSVYDPNQRYYAGVPEEKRRSFWRRSIRPEDIGLAIAPKVNEEASPNSVASHQSMVKLLPKAPWELPGRALWPASLKLDATRQLQQQGPRPLSDETVFDEDIEAQAQSLPDLLGPGSSFSLAPLPKARLAGPRTAPLRLNPVDVKASCGSPTKKAVTRLPLTPTYDNGNVANSTMRQCPPTSWKSGHINILPQDIQRSYISEDDDQNAVPGNRNVLRKKTITKMPIKGNSQVGQTPLVTSKAEPLRKDSGTTAATDIDEMSTSGEAEKPLETLQTPTGVPIPTRSSDAFALAQRSPISNLRYPSIPRSAAVSRQAEHVPQPRRSPTDSVPNTSNRPTRDALVRNGASFMITDTTSSDGYLSDRSIDWPAPPMTRDSLKGATAVNQSAFKANMMRLRENADCANRGSLGPKQGPSLDQVIKTPNKPRSRIESQQLPTTSMSNTPVPMISSTGDLFFKVEM